MSAGCRTASIPIARAGAGSGSGASEDPSTRLCRLPEIARAAANKEIRRLLDFAFPFIARFDDRDLRGEFTREDAKHRPGGISHNA